MYDALNKEVLIIFLQLAMFQVIFALLIKAQLVMPPLHAGLVSADLCGAVRPETPELQLLVRMLRQIGLLIAWHPSDRHFNASKTSASARLGDRAEGRPARPPMTDSFQLSASHCRLHASAVSAARKGRNEQLTCDTPRESEIAARLAPGFTALLSSKCLHKHGWRYIWAATQSARGKETFAGFCLGFLVNMMPGH